MDDAEKHFPPGAEPEPTAEVTETPTEIETPSAETPAAVPEAETPGEHADETPDPDAPAEAEKPEPDVTRPRSIYQDLKDKKQQVKDWKAIAITALKAQGIEVQGNETVADLSALLANKANAETPAENREADDELKTFAEAEGLTEDGLKKLIDVIAKHVSPISDEDRQELDNFRKSNAERAETERRAAEDNATRSQAPMIKKELAISDDKELEAVMAKIVVLTHTKKYFDKDVDYIVFKEKAELAKLVSPKKKSFESGSHSPAEGTAPTVDFSKGGVTPLQAAAATKSGPKSSLEVRASR